MKFKPIAAAVLIILCAVLIWRCSGYPEANRIVGEIRQGRRIETRMGNGSTAPLFLAPAADVLRAHNFPAIPLIEASCCSHVQAVETLLKNGADPNRHIPGRWTAIEAALITRRDGLPDERSTAIIALLLEHGADPALHSGQELPPAELVAQWIRLGNGNPAMADILRLLENAAGNP